ncbi:MAG TPA: MBOAT family O-acyltransferase, partial [bacterium]|nr:MBOAT family O-acyltransferase [bacterium]
MYAPETMVFSSPVFLFVFLPLVLLVYALARPAWRNAVLLFFSLMFYAWGETVYVVLMLGSIGFNYLLGRRIRALGDDILRRRLVAAGVAGNLILLGIFKYAGFFMEIIRDIWVRAGGAPFDIPGIHLPIGISFFTFQAMSYLIDIYRRVEGGTTRFVDCALYISLFPQLIAGPIVRYHQIAGQIRFRTHGIERFARGIERFITGLAKKIILADSAGYIADKIFEVPVAGVTSSMAWLGLIAYTLQIYFDFSGYSDMAIGLGRFFGFELPENFNYPYVSRSIREFWRRWHISLSTWFRDYLYLPLGGNRISPARTYL